MHPRESLARAADAGLGIGQPRLLALAVLASLALHVLVLYALPILKETIQAPARPLTAQLAKPAAPEPARVEPPPQRPLQPPAAPRTVPVAKAAPQIAAPAPAPIAAAPAPSVVPKTQAVEAVPAPPSPQASSASSDAAPGSAPGPAASAPDPGSVARYRLELMEIAPRYKRYPRIAQDNNWEGRAELRIAIAESGSIASLTVKKGTGRVALDDAAQSMIRSAQAQTVIPPALRGKAFALDVAVDFVLREGK
jgi:protein TonB